MLTKVAIIERFLPLAILTVAIVAVPVMIFSRSGLPRLNNLRTERVAAQREVSRLGQEIRELRVQVQEMKTDPVAVERVARDQLGLVRQTELVFQFEQ